MPSEHLIVLFALYCEHCLYNPETAILFHVFETLSHAIVILDLIFALLRIIILTLTLTMASAGGLQTQLFPKSL